MFGGGAHKKVSLSGGADRMLLSDVITGQSVKLVVVEGGQALKSRLATMGLLPGSQIRVIRNDANGPFIVEAKGSRVILGRGMAHRIEVS